MSKKKLQKDGLNNFDFSVSYPGITEGYLLETIKRITDPLSDCKKIYLSTSEKPPRCLVFERIISARLMDDFKTPYNYSFRVHGG